ncbi:hypothetical protein J4457_00165 [Candidatus Woesearchaeota archaeon]|nr:hypothetical protein [Candidatus Woesearchaeota archaeon]
MTVEKPVIEYTNFDGTRVGYSVEVFEDGALRRTETIESEGLKRFISPFTDITDTIQIDPKEVASMGDSLRKSGFISGLMHESVQDPSYSDGRTRTLGMGYKELVAVGRTLPGEAGVVAESIDKLFKNKPVKRKPTERTIKRAA